MHSGLKGSSKHSVISINNSNQLELQLWETLNNVAFRTAKRMQG